MAEAQGAGDFAGRMVIKNIGLLLSGDLNRPILDADTIVADKGRITAESAFDLVPEIHRIFKDLNIKLDSFSVNTTTDKHVIQFDADVTHHQQDKVLSALTRPSVSLEMLPVERQPE